MLAINYWAIIVTGIVALLEGALWNSPLLFGKARSALANVPADTSGKPPLGQMLAELVRQLIVAYILARLLTLLSITDWWGAVQLGAWLWLGFQAAAIVGGVIWERMPPKLFAIHAGDALVKTLIMTSILGVWH